MYNHILSEAAHLIIYCLKFSNEMDIKLILIYLLSVAPLLSFPSKTDM